MRAQGSRYNDVRLIEENGISGGCISRRLKAYKDSFCQKTSGTKTSWVISDLRLVLVVRVYLLKYLHTYPGYLG